MSSALLPEARIHAAIRYAGHQRAESVVKLGGLLIERGDLVTHLTHFYLLLAGIGAGFTQFADFLRLGVALRFELFGFGQRGAAFRVELAERLYVERERRSASLFAIVSRLFLKER